MKHFIRIATSLSVFPAIYLLAGFTMVDLDAWNWPAEVRGVIAFFGPVYAGLIYAYPGWYDQ